MRKYFNVLSCLTISMLSLSCNSSAKKVSNQSMSGEIEVVNAKVDNGRTLESAVNLKNANRVDECNGEIDKGSQGDGKNRKSRQDGIQPWMILDGYDRVVEVNGDFSKVLANSVYDYLGYIGNDYQRLFIDINSARRTGGKQYYVTGESRVRNNACKFEGDIEILSIREKTYGSYGVDDYMEGKVRRRGCCIAKYSLREDPKHFGSGVFAGYLLFYWYENNHRHIVYDNIDIDSDAYSNCQYAGTWQSYKTNKVKPCCWGQCRIPNSGDLDIGSCEFIVNPKYRSKGWEGFIQAW